MSRRSNGSPRVGQQGFTLMEVMIALAILAGGLAISIAATVSNVRQAHRAQMLGVVTNLARGKMYDIEEALIKDGYQELEKTEDGDFSDEGWSDVKWEAKIEKVELPGLGALQGADGEGAEDGAAGGMGSDIADSAGGFAGAGLIGSQFEMIANVLERSIRRVTLKVTWRVGQQREDMSIVCYFTNSQGVDEAMAGAPADTGDTGDTGGTGGDDGGGGGSQRSSSSGTRAPRGGGN